MNNKIFDLKIKPFLYLIPLLLVILFSFFTFSEAYYPLLNSDSALNILMAHSYNLPHDIYCWGQDRGGTLIPMIAYFFIKIFKIHAYWSCSLAHYLVLVSGYIAIALMLRSKLARIALAVVWFLPPFLMIDFTLGPFSTQYSVLAVAFYLINKIFYTERKNKISQSFYLCLICFVLFISIWVSDLSALTIFILIIFVMFYNTSKGNIALKKIISSKELLISVLFILITFIFIYYTKAHAEKTTTYSEKMLNSISDIWKSVIIFSITIFKMISFRSKEPSMSIYLYSVLLSIFVLIFFTKKSKNNNVDQYEFNWALFFLINAVLSFLLLIFSHWVFLNGVNRRYFSVVFVSLWLAFLFYADKRNFFSNKLFLTTLILTLCCSVISGVFSFYYPVKMKPAIEVSAELKPLGKIGIIGEYWNSYINSCPDPDNIKTTPNDKETYRNQKMIDDVFSQPALYIIKDMWMKTFPDTIEQFGYVLHKKGEQFFIANSYICQYEILKMHKLFSIDTFKHKGVVVNDTAAIHKQSIYAQKEDKDNYSVFLYGPFITLGKGKYKVSFHLRTEKNIPEDTLAILDVSNNWGAEVLTKKYLTTKDLKNEGKYNFVDIVFDASKRLTSTEFRITYFGKAPLWFDCVELTEQ